MTTKAPSCNCEMKDTWARIHPKICRLWNNKEYREGRMDWDPDKQMLVDVWEEFDNTHDLPACKCEPEKKWFCAMCNVRRDQAWHEWQSADTFYSSGTKSNFEVKDRHCMTPLVFPNGVTVYGSSMNKQGDVKPDFGIYLASGWLPQCLGFIINWQDFGLPKINWEQVLHAAQEAYKLAESGWKVEVGCIGGHGRTGTFLACLAVLAGVPAELAVAYVRKEYCKHAVETKEQEFFVIQFDAMNKGEEVPVYIKPPLVIENSKKNKTMTIYNGSVVTQKELELGS